MGSTLTVYGDVRQDVYWVDSFGRSDRSFMKPRNAADKIHIIRSVEINADAGPVDKTLLTVPEGYVFLLHRISGSKSTTGTYGLRVYDAAGDSVTPANNAITRFSLTSELDAVPAMDWTFVSPIVVINGITLDSANTPATALTYIVMEGYLVSK